MNPLANPQPAPQPVPMQAVPVEPLSIEAIIKLAEPVMSQYQQTKLATERLRAEHEAKLAEHQKELQLQQLSNDRLYATQRFYFTSGVIVTCLLATCVIAWLARDLFAVFLNVVSFIIGAVFGERLHRSRKVSAQPKAEHQADEGD